MRLLISTALALTAALVAAGPAIDLSAAPKPANPRVKLTFVDDQFYKIQSDDGQPYTDGTGGVSGYIDLTNGALYFGTGNSGRKLQFSFDQCTSGCLPASFVPPVGAPYPSGSTKATIFAGVRDGGGNKIPGGMLGMSPGGVPLWSAIHLNMPLDDDPAYWTLCMNSPNADGFCAFSARSTPARIIRTAPGAWTISAIAGEVGELINDKGSKGRTRIIEYLGTYSMSFSFTVECVANCPS